VDQGRVQWQAVRLPLVWHLLRTARVTSVISYQTQTLRKHRTATDDASLKHTAESSRHCSRYVLKGIPNEISVYRSLNSSVTVVTSLPAGQLRNHGSISGNSKTFSSLECSDRPWSPCSLLFNWYWRIKRSECEANH
jgi:hypothetical protein